MNKQDWTYKKLGEVAYFINGDRGRNYPSQNDFVESGIPFINAGHLNDGKIDFESMNYINEAKFNSLNSGKIKEGDILFCLRGSLGKRAIVNGLERGAIASSLVILRCETVLNQYLYYFLGSPIISRHIQKSNNGSSQPNLSAKSVSNFNIPVPPAAEQERIVAELDLLQGIIEKKKEQLKAYDQLAQSIFYTMFGDPIDNPKGWEVKKLGEVCSLKAGKAIKAAELKEKQDNLYPCYGGNGIRGFIDKVSHKEDFPIIGRQGALCGNVNFARGPFYATEHAVVVTPLIEMNMIWLFYELKCSNLEQYAHGVAQPGIAVNDLNPIHFPLPPLSLQQEFAEKIEAIERQKALVQQSIEEVQTMFDCTMDKYFG